MTGCDEEPVNGNRRAGFFRFLTQNLNLTRMQGIQGIKPLKLFEV